MVSSEPLEGFHRIIITSAVWLISIAVIHYMHLMHPNYCQVTILSVVHLCSSLAYFMMTQPLPIAGKLPIKILVARQLPTSTDTHLYNHDNYNPLMHISFVPHTCTGTIGDHKARSKQLKRRNLRRQNQPTRRARSAKRSQRTTLTIAVMTSSIYSLYQIHKKTNFNVATFTY